MENTDILIIGGSAAGITTAISARRYYPEAKIVVIRREKQVLIPCGIPYIFGTVGTPENNLIPDAVLEKNNIELIVDPAIELRPDEKTVLTEGGETVSYDKLVLATGSNAMVPPIPGIDKKNVFPVQKDVEYLASLLETLKDVKDLVILGCGFIGVEFADECKKGRDINVTIVEMLTQCLEIAFGETTCKCCKEIEDHLIERGINIITQAKLEEVLGDEHITGVRLSDGRVIKADALIVGIGVTPNTGLAEKAGLEVNRGGIVVDTNMRTSDPNIFACGDCTTKFSFFTGQPSGLRLASIASTEGRIAGANLFGVSRKNTGAVGVFSTAIGNLTVAMAGMSAKGAEGCGFEVVTGEAEAPDRHPGGMPGMSKMWVRLVFNKVNGELVGGMVRGGPSAGEVINTISACIQTKQTANDIAMFQLGTHPAVTASPIAYQLVNAAEIALKDMKS
ncbi:MAG: FAD-dependent oxidoreductase [Thermoplasmata archaeon]|nr:FAD-dependent oxidoreductase [Thermoplasmata archaeon]